MEYADCLCVLPKCFNPVKLASLNTMFHADFKSTAFMRHAVNLTGQQSLRDVEA